jgi:hypothetical protein
MLVINSVISPSANAHTHLAKLHSINECFQESGSPQIMKKQEKKIKLETIRVAVNKRKEIS